VTIPLRIGDTKRNVKCPYARPDIDYVLWGLGL
jgi:hypothetical protein